MRRLKSIETDQVSLEVVECDCGFHLGVDAHWLDQSSNASGYAIPCPACNCIIPIDDLTKD